MTAAGADFAGPAFVVPADGRPVVHGASGLLTRREIVARARNLAGRLPDGPGALNLCESRGHFLTALLALQVNRQVCLMPPSRAPAVLDTVQANHPGSFRIDDELVAGVSGTTCSTVQDVTLDPDRVAAIGYTSGSTGQPTASAKTWASLAWPTLFNARGLREVACGGRTDTSPWIVATVPSQHMYGMEFTAMLPLLAGLAIHDSHPLFPADVAAALAATAAPRVLVSTPVHLRALVESGVDLPPTAAVVSATAPLSAELAARVENDFGTRVLEFFGSTETCVIASRQTAREPSWLPHPGVRIAPGPDGATVEAPWLTVPMPMQDLFDVAPDGRFRILGRSADMVEVAGKRASIGDLTRRLLGIAGVRDAVVLQPAEPGSARVRRLVAFVVCEGISAQGIAAALAGQVDPAFVPRPIVLVDRLPRNDVGKLPRDRLLELVRNHGLDATGQR